MGFTDDDGRGEPTAAMFERALLASARADGPPAGAASDAWAKFTETAGAVGKIAPAAGIACAAGRFARGATRWLLMGAIAGSALTAAWMGPGRRSDVSPAPTLSSPPAPPVSVSAAISGAPDVAPGVASSWAERGSSPGVALAPVVAARSLRRGTRASTLAAEVAALDAASAAMSAGAFDDALGIIGRYHRDLPAGELAADADVLAIEALAAKGDRTEATRQAERFLTLHPRDPHVVRIRWLVEH